MEKSHALAAMSKPPSTLPYPLQNQIVYLQIVHFLEHFSQISYYTKILLVDRINNSVLLSKLK